MTTLPAGIYGYLSPDEKMVLEVITMDAAFETDVPARWREILDTDPPAHDPVFQELRPAGYIIRSHTVEKRWQVLDRPLATVYAEQMALGYEDAALGIKLKTTRDAQQWFTSQMALVQLALSAGVYTAASPVQVWDFFDAPQTISVSDYLALMLRYGQHCQQLFALYAP